MRASRVFNRVCSLSDLCICYAQDVAPSVLVLSDTNVYYLLSAFRAVLHKIARRSAT